MPRHSDNTWLERIAGYMSGGGSPNQAQRVQGNVSDDETDVGDPVKIGGVKPDGTRGDAQLDSAQNLLVSLATKLAGEDITNDVIKTEQRFSGILVAADALIKTGAGFLHTVTFTCNDAAPTAGSFILFDNTAESGTQLVNHTFTTTPFAPCTIIIDCTFATGLYAGFTTTADVNVTISWR